MSWYDRARQVIATVHSELPADVSFADRKKAIFDAYPFGERSYHPYKQWCKAQREYLAKYNPKQKTPGGLFDQSTSLLDQ
jgi:hypothetical protein